MLERGTDGSFVEPDEELRREAQTSLREVEGRLVWGQRLGLAFAGVSLGSILLLAALGLAITYGLMGVINMAHGELIMIGAYATYVVQNLFRAHAPGAFDWYLVCAVPVAFVVAAAVGMVLERLVIRWLYGRPLETLLATWGIGLMLIQGVRTVFGAQNVEVENPAFMSGGIEVMPDVVLPWNRIVIILFAVGVLVAMGLLLAKHPARPVRARRHAEPRDGRLRRRADRARGHVGVRPRGRGSPDSRAARSRRSATSAPTSARRTSSTRSWSWCSAASASSPGLFTRRSGWGSSTSCSNPGRAR